MLTCDKLLFMEVKPYTIHKTIGGQSVSPFVATQFIQTAHCDECGRTVRIHEQHLDYGLGDGSWETVCEYGHVLDED